MLCGLLLPADVIDRPPLDSKRQVIERQVIERQGPLAAAGVRPEHERVVVEPFVERLLEAR